MTLMITLADARRCAGKGPAKSAKVRAVHGALERCKRLQPVPGDVNLVSMTRLTDPTPRASARPPAPPGHWLLQDAKARFSELVRRVRSEGPQHVTVHGRDEVVVIAVEEFRRLQGLQTGRALIDALQASPHQDIDLAPTPAPPAPVRDVVL